MKTNSVSLAMSVTPVVHKRCVLSLTLLVVLLLSLVLNSIIVSTGFTQNVSLRERMFGSPGDDNRSTFNGTAEFTTENGLSFIFDTSRSVPLLRYGGEGEIWVLTASPAAKGDIVYKNDLGETILKTTRWGGIILFTKDKPGGVPAAMSGRADPIRPPHMGPRALFQQLTRASRAATEASGHLIRFWAEVEDPAGDFIFADTAYNAAQAISDVASRPNGRKRLKDLTQVQIIEGHPPGARYEKGILRIFVDSSRGYWRGRPSSLSIARALR